MLYALPLTAIWLAGCCTSPALNTFVDLTTYGLEANRRGELLECRVGEWWWRAGLERVEL